MPRNELLQDLGMNKPSNSFQAYNLQIFEQDPDKLQALPTISLYVGNISRQETRPSWPPKMIFIPFCCKNVWVLGCADSLLGRIILGFRWRWTKFTFPPAALISYWFVTTRAASWYKTSVALVYPGWRLAKRWFQTSVDDHRILGQWSVVRWGVVICNHLFLQFCHTQSHLRACAGTWGCVSSHFEPDLLTGFQC